ncbi:MULTISPECIES: pyridoxal phosphate-dependent aminotransferase [Gammaproteobacteria]|jgi:aspartate/methionine/tyrosine aminotransferase|uniref:Aminotransferase n=1 Tax=Vreelandella halophila TaxID=86177 RepID=A0A9X4YBV9_9GAMM|nr:MULTISPECIES: pyridoxal phosphate-dependent aminotransferase [Gammaproteobacteria]KAA8978512.1 pyridoxal phosphate-dependent aminotransferase [Halospina sp. K52047b]MYL26385.1 aminotransferase class I/II-fold pyridoxal phosphate-dependent enzyme [Halomonas utahensis]MYL73722.1 aminotransferase class I/II-fold pyridoxal phosphate-dependent enzyme [Halomonas sp. 22501_18_FS]
MATSAGKAVPESAPKRKLTYRKTKARWHPSMQAIPVPGIRRMVNMAAEMDDVIHLSIGQPDLPTPKHVTDAMVDSIQAGQTGYTMDAGLPELLVALRDYYGNRYGRKLSTENILVTSGATEAMYLALSATAAPGRQFLVVDPSFLLYAPLIRMNGGEVKFIPTRPENGHQLDPDDIIKNISMRTFAVVLNSPNNPTGAVYPKSTIERIVEECAFRGIQVFSDEVYDHLVLDDEEYSSVLSCGTDLDHLMCISSFSKTYSMAGLRVGWIISSQGAIKKLRRYHMFTTSVANTPAQFAGVAALEGDQQSVRDMIEIYRERRDLIVDLVNQTPYLTGYKPNGGFFIFPDLPDHVDASDLCLRMLKETGVCAVPGDAFGEHCTNSIRFSFSTTSERIQEAFERIIPWMKKQNL